MHVAMVAAVWKYAVDSLCLCLFCMFILSALYLYLLHLCSSVTKVELEELHWKTNTRTTDNMQEE